MLLLFWYPECPEYRNHSVEYLEHLDTLDTPGTPDALEVVNILNIRDALGILKNQVLGICRDFKCTKYSRHKNVKCYSKCSWCSFLL